MAGLTLSALQENILKSSVNTINTYSLGDVKTYDYTRAGENRFGSLTELGSSTVTFDLTTDSRTFTSGYDVAAIKAIMEATKNEEQKQPERVEKTEKTIRATCEHNSDPIFCGECVR